MPVTSLEELRETLTASGGASNLVPKIIDRLLLEYKREQAPLTRAIPRKTWLTDVYYFNERTALPLSQMTTEAPSTTDVAASQSTYTQVKFPIKHMQSQLDISTFAAKVAMVNGNLFDLELAGAAKTMSWHEEINHLWGAANATVNTKRPQWDGIDIQVASANKINGNAQLLTLNVMDNMIDSIRGVAAQDLGDNWFYVMSPKMQSKVNSLFVNQQRFNLPMATLFSRDDFGIPNAPIADNLISAGVEVSTYRSIPIVTSTFLSNALGQMGTLTVSDAGGSGSSLTNIPYYYIVEAVTKQGLLYASAEGTATPTSGHNVSVSWATPTPTDAFGNTIDIIGYRIYRSTTSGAETLYALVSAYNLSDVAVTSFTDTGLIQDPTVTNTLYWQTVAKSGSNAASDGVTYARGGANNEDIYLIPRDPEYIVAPVTVEMTTQMLAPVNARTRQFALTQDMTLAMRAGAFAAKTYNIKFA